MNRYIYVRVEVRPADPAAQSLLNTLAEAATGKPQPDIISQLGPSSISFKHRELIAESEDEAYLNGWNLLGDPKPGAVCNDYVILLNESLP